MTARFADPTEAPTRADRAYDRALNVKEARAEIIADETRRCAENMWARLSKQGVGLSKYLRDSCADYNANYGTNKAPLQYLAEFLQEIADDAFEQLQSPESAADDEGLDPGENLRERD